MKRILILICSSFIFFSSCNNFLEEEQVGTLTAEYYETPEGFESLVRGCYNFLRFKTGWEWTYAMYEFGGDVYTESDEHWNLWPEFNRYTGQLNATAPGIGDMWNFQYEAINNCNEAIARIDNVDADVGILSTEEGKNSREAEVRFLRAYYYFMLVRHFGAIPMPTDPSRSPQTEWPKSPVSDVYELIINDLRFAVEHLPPSQDDYGRATKDAARHFLAKAYLTRGCGSDPNVQYQRDEHQRGAKPTDMDSAAFYADAVINSGNHNLLSDYADLWDIDNQLNSEVIFAIQFDTEATNIQGDDFESLLGNRTHLYWLNRYDTEPGIERALDIGRPYRRMMNTEYSINNFDRQHDSRARKSLYTVFMSNQSADNAPTWSYNELEYAFDNFDPSDSSATNAQGETLEVGEPKFSEGDTALVFLLNDENTTLTDREIVRKGYTIYARYYQRTDDSGNPVETIGGDNPIDGTSTTPVSGVTINTWREGKVPSLWKYVDGQRSGINSTYGTRDYFLARLAETYLISAEAHGRNGDFGTAVDRINTLRQRAAYKSGESVSAHIQRFDDVQTGQAESEMMIDQSAWGGGQDYPDYVSSQQDRFIHFILNERAREMMGELHRWEALVRCGVMQERALAYNPWTQEYNAVQQFHHLRPIPQDHLDLITTGGNNLSDTERSNYQNPGYE